MLVGDAAAPPPALSFSLPPTMDISGVLEVLAGHEVAAASRDKNDYLKYGRDVCVCVCVCVCGGGGGNLAADGQAVASPSTPSSPSSSPSSSSFSFSTMVRIVVQHF